MTCPSVAVVVLICWPAVIFLAAAVREFVGRAEQRIAGGQERGGGGDEHGDHDGHRGGQDEACAEGHVPRRTYPTPRTVWMHRGSPPASVLRRR